MATPPKLLDTLLRGIVVAAIALFSSVAAADAASEARTRYERAVKLYEDGVYDAALVEFTRAYELNPSYKVLYNLAQVRVAMLDFAGAVEAFQQYLREGGGQVPSARVDAVTHELSRLEQRVGRLIIETDVSGAEILVDDVLVGTSPLANAVLVNSGMRRITVRHAAHFPQTQRVSIAGGERSQVTLPLSSRPTATTKVEPQRTPPEPEPARATTSTTLSPAVALRAEAASAPRARSVLTYVVSGVTVGLGLTAGSLAIAALLKNSKLDERRDQPGEDVASFDDERTRLRRVARAADGLALGALVGLGVSTWLWLRPGREQAAPTTRATSHRSVVDARPRGAAHSRSQLRLSLLATGLQLSGDF